MFSRLQILSKAERCTLRPLTSHSLTFSLLKKAPAASLHTEATQSKFCASSRNRTDACSLEDCNAAITPHSPFNAGAAGDILRFQKVFLGLPRIFSYPERESNPLKTGQDGKAFSHFPVHMNETGYPAKPPHGPGSSLSGKFS